MSATETFDVFEDGWIPALAVDGNPRLVGVFDAFARAHELRWIDADAPVMTAALHRLLFAFALRIYGPADAATWRELWHADAFPEDPLVDYRQRYRSRWDLFDHDRPFLQCPGLPREKLGSTAQLVFGQCYGSNTTLFDHTTATERPELSPDVAARWLVTLHAYDTGGLKTPSTSDKSSQRGPANYVALALAEGATLKDTLLMNMVPGVAGAQDCPPWEQKQPPGPEPVKGRSPQGWVDVLTWPSRRVLLNPARRGAELVVDRVVITPGDQMPRDVDLTAIDQMAGRRPQTGTRGKATATEPVIVGDPERGWRDAADLLVAPGRPGTLDHIATHVPGASRCTLRVFGQELDRYGGSLQDWREESLPAPVSVLHRPREHWAAQLLRQALWLSDEAGKNLEQRQADYITHATPGRDTTSSRGVNARVQYWSALSREFTTFLQGLDDVLAESVTETQARSHAATISARWREAVLTHADTAAGRDTPHGSAASGRQMMARDRADDRFDTRAHQRLRAQDEGRVAALTVILDTEEDTPSES